ncbi:carbamoyl-phosphate synthase large subunit [Akkermansia glycaniphila]|uniref:Cpsaseii lrg: carbamoyl-phosphate synthase large subunit n=1 Tax=Akkermansia glycaniphila TaxID=1679444 RepID=A0A1C7P9F7_9BACT|nr:carbamoyl-phosphate synthase large subunit [Akkermansia glycaniphila]OCA01994.1 carbamoyl phosphate synthase large subunit [Akkermansia glycaniphila]SEH93012.1 cpsaseii lrg: carbamoyl-phosphate synthase large subunit [Akkermansia glycaniphila]
MAKRDDIKKVLIIGSGPIVIGQACEFDYSGTQACKALRAQGYEVVLVNSNPATIMTDPSMADRTYIEPLTVDRVTAVIDRERPDALLPNLGGQTALNLASSLHEQGILEQFGVRVIGVDLDAIARGEDRIIFKETMNQIGVPVAKSEPIYTVEEAEKVADEMGYPVVLRPAYTMGGTGGGIVFNVEELREVVARGIAASLINQVLVEECALGWEELELEVVRDSKGQKITVCYIENVDPMGVHTGDSFCVAPMLTVPKELQERLQDYSYRILEAIGVTGGTNVQFAHNREDDRVIVIEINPRTSRSSALASKATGFPIASVSTLLASGVTMDELPYWRKGTLEKYEPWGDYVVVKFARWAFEKFPKAKDKLGTQMKAVGEVMSIGKDFKEAFQKAVRSLEVGRCGLGRDKKLEAKSTAELKEAIATANSLRFFQIYELLRRGVTVADVVRLTAVTPYFIEEMKELADFDNTLDGVKWADLSDEKLVQAKKLGFSDKYLAKVFEVTEKDIRTRRIAMNLVASYQVVPVSGVENAEYYYSTYNGAPDAVKVSDKKKIMILGGGPNRIGQGIEFDYTCVHAAFALRDAGYESIMINCNPETVSTDYDTANKLYFEPVTVEDVLTIYEKEKPEGVIVQFGGQTPLNIAQELKDAGVKILGTQPEGIRLAEDREYFRERMISLDIPQPESGTARSLEEAVELGRKIGYPVMVRPSFVLGGRGMEVIYDEENLMRYGREAIQVSPDFPMLIDRFLDHAIEAEVDALSDGKDTFVATVMEHIELAGIHSGDSACAIPPVSLPEKHVKTMEAYASAIAKDFKVDGILNVQFAVCEDKVYIIEANPRASRTVPIVAKVTGIPLARYATMLMLGASLESLGIERPVTRFVGVKEAVFPFNMFPEVDPVLGPEMRATGEVMGVSDNFGMAYFKAQEAAGSKLPLGGTVLLTVSPRDKEELEPIARDFVELGFKLVATEGTAKLLNGLGIPAVEVKKLHEGRPNLGDMICNQEIDLVINTPIGREGKIDDSYIRMTSIRHKVPYMTTMAAAKATIAGIRAAQAGKVTPKCLQEYHG